MSVRAQSHLPLRHRHVRIGLTMITGALALVAVVCSALAMRYQERIVEASRYNGTFDFSQGAVELLRLQLALERRPQPNQISEINLRYGIFNNRLKVLKSNPILKEAGYLPMVENLESQIREIGETLAGSRDIAVLAQQGQRLTPIVPSLMRLVSVSHARTGDVILQNQQELKLISAILYSIILALVAFGAILITLVFRQNGKLDEAVRTDALTGLSNRLDFKSVITSPAIRGQTHSVIVIDVDHFKALNDTLGHDAGDLFLSDLSRRLQRAAPDGRLVARMGGDEFAILYSGPDADRRSTAACERILSIMRIPFLIDGREIHSSVTMGLSHSGGEGETSDELYKNADIALYISKTEGRGRFRAFRPDMKHALMRRQKLQADLGEAIARDEFFLLFQPIVDLATGRTRGFEALLRWQHPELGLIPPLEFISIAEESGQIGAIGRWVVEAACRQAARWPESIFVAVNVSAKQLTDPRLAEDISSCIRSHGITAQRLEIEITETALIENDETAVRTLHTLRENGCRISLDDFGTGYASLSYLCRFPFDKLKIDRSFVRNAVQNTESITVIHMVCALAEKLGLNIVAEGIEMEDQRRLLQAASCQYGQGYLFARPLSANDSEQRLGSEHVFALPLSA
ncbi:putative bifunctional diguanylate cyclase/phosphodiesterase [Aureimonas sp. D3]|uniref:putative bifunctional diguanylate cyclase/phosphodiesterase n=1 Tax=Aureimonas sp. D3 TaxID=1638164 RepID=UPI000783E805|nr:EAL domain-containing protein [Aureimonas sp. D3]